MTTESTYPVERMVECDICGRTITVRYMMCACDEYGPEPHRVGSGSFSVEHPNYPDTGKPWRAFTWPFWTEENIEDFYPETGLLHEWMDR